MYKPIGKEFVSYRKVYFGDTDAAGVVYHGRYIYWMEASRIDFLENVGLPYEDLQKERIGLIPSEINIKYMRPMKFGDKFSVKTCVSGLWGGSIEMSTVFECSDQIICKASVKLVCLDESKWKPRRLLPELIDCIKKYEEKE
jgi:acyl-CoA thioester hydrolase